MSQPRKLKIKRFAVGGIAGGFMGNFMGAASNVAAGANGVVQNYTGTQQVINQGAHKLMQSFGPWGQLASAVTGAADAIGASLGAKVDVLNSNTASRAGVSGANKAGEMLSAIPGMGWVTGLFAQKTDQGNKSAYIDGMSPGYSKSVQDINAAVDGGSKKMLFGAKKMNEFIRKQNQANELITDIAMQSELARQNDAATLYQSQNFNKYSGSTPRLLMAKEGIKFQELDSAKMLLSKLRGVHAGVSKYQLGGKIIDPSKNIIPDGAMHKNLNHLSEANEELDGQVTTKGIPVVSESADGTITQHAEVEVGEVIFNLANTKTIEYYWKQYQETGDDSIAIECGKFLTKELLHNTVDKAGIKKEIE